MPAALTDSRTVARVFRVVAIAEAVSWVLLLAGMFVKWVLKTTAQPLRAERRQRPRRLARRAGDRRRPGLPGAQRGGGRARRPRA
ncbi:DUF3817 domain-containing protein, partial [Modestobacter versicolor]|uniref:DUF3817 domain-containing protein n=1 Tax=Modestobacter versicolor TaxID=429133 RepID=UPI001C648549